MNALAIVVCALAGAGVGAVAGAMYGFATDNSDMPIMAAFTTPIGALAGGFVGVVVGSAVFA